MSGLLLRCTELTLFCTELPENCIYLNQLELSNFSCSLLRLKSQGWHEVQLPFQYIHFEIAQIQDLVSSNILLMQYWPGLIHIFIFGGKNKSFGNLQNGKLQNLHRILFVFHFPAIWLVTLNKPWNLIACFVFSVACALAGKKMRFKAKNGAIRE